MRSWSILCDEDQSTVPLRRTCIVGHIVNHTILYLYKHRFRRLYRMLISCKNRYILPNILPTFMKLEDDIWIVWFSRKSAIATDTFWQTSKIQSRWNTASCQSILPHRLKSVHSSIKIQYFSAACSDTFCCWHAQFEITGLNLIGQGK